MSERLSCAAFVLNEPELSNGRIIEIATQIGFDDLEYPDGNTAPHRTVSGSWAGLFSRIRIKNLTAQQQLFCVTFLFQDLNDLIVQANANSTTEAPIGLTQFVTSFAYACDLLKPNLAFVELTPLENIMEFLEYAAEPLSKHDYAYFAHGIYPLLYFNDEIADGIRDWDLERARDNVPMRQGKLFYYGAGSKRWDLFS